MISDLILDEIHQKKIFVFFDCNNKISFDMNNLVQNCNCLNFKYLIANSFLMKIKQSGNFYSLGSTKSKLSEYNFVVKAKAKKLVILIIILFTLYYFLFFMYI